jgi:anti-sigma regulatory factor (Ser/Thr protein kinase)
MTVAVEDIAVGCGEHAVRFYERESDLSRTVGRYLVDAAQDGAVAIVVATEAHRRAFVAELEAAGLDPADSFRSGTLVLLDAAATLTELMREGRVDRDAFDHVIGGVLREGAKGGRPLRVFGEMVALLWESGNVLEAIQLEKLWNELRDQLEFSLLCAYRGESASGPVQAESLRQVCQLHSSVFDAPAGDEHAAPRRATASDEVRGHFPAELDAPGKARHLVADALGAWGHGGVLVDDAQLVVTELATNAVVHARSPFTVVAEAHDRGVRVSVQDVSHVQPRLRAHELLASSGRGLQLVAAIAVDWGVELTADGKTVWAELRP